MFAQRLLSRAAPFVTSIRTHVPIQSASAFNLPRFALYSTATAQSPLSEAAAPLQPLAPSSTQTTSLSETDADADADASKLADLPYPSLTPAYASSIVPAAGTKGLLDFFDSEKGWYWNDTDPKTGRGWTCAELRNKSFYDLHKLWWICIKEQNKLLSQKDEARMFKVIFPNGVRLQQVRVTMRGIRMVIHERRIAYLQAQAIVQRESTRQDLFATHLAAYKLANNITSTERIYPAPAEVTAKVAAEMKKLFPVPVHEIGRKSEERRRIEKALEKTAGGAGRKKTTLVGEKRVKKGSRWTVV